VQAAVRLLHPLLSMDEPLATEGPLMNPHAPQVASCEQEELYSVDQAPDDNKACETAQEWAGLRPELLDLVLDP
jgi:hypothetical protein